MTGHDSGGDGPPGVRCRDADIGDIPAINALHAVAYPGSEPGRLTDQLANPDVRLFVAVAGAEVAAYGRLRYFADVTPAGHYLGGVVVAPGWRRRGVGTVLTAHRIDAAWAAGAQVVYYFANSRNIASITMHESFGFREIKRPFAFPGVTFTGGTGVLFGLGKPA